MSPSAQVPAADIPVSSPPASSSINPALLALSDAAGDNDDHASGAQRDIRDSSAHEEEQHRFESDEEDDVASEEEQQEECDEEEEEEEEGEDNEDEHAQDRHSPKRRKAQSLARPETNKRKKTGKATTDADIIAAMARGGGKGLAEPTKRSLCEYR